MAKYTLENSFDINTKELYESGMEIKKICNAINDDINILFEKYEKITSGCWVGDSAEGFVEKSKTFRVELNKFVEWLIKYGDCLCDIANEYDTFPEKVGVE